MYKALTPYSPKGSSQPLIFNCLDETMHMQMKRPIAPLFSVSNVIKFECHIDSTLAILFDQLDERYVKSGQNVNLTDWLQYFAFDTMSNITLFHTWEYLSRGSDYNGLLRSMWEFIKTAAPVRTDLGPPAHTSARELNLLHSLHITLFLVSNSYENAQLSR